MSEKVAKIKQSKNKKRISKEEEKKGKRDLEDRLSDFAVWIIKLVESLPNTKSALI